MKNILHIAEQKLDKEKLFQYLNDIESQSLDIIQVSTIEEGEEVIFQVPITLIMIDWSLPGAPEFINALKSDEMFRLLPVVAIITDETEELIKEVYLNGADNFISTKTSDMLIALSIRPLILNNVLNDELVKKISALQEQAIHDFILLDLIKKYIPKTIWDLANDFAYEQKIHIPEEELELTIAFGDIKAFTNMSQHLEPRDVIENLNAVFEIVTKIIYDNNGDIDKFIGDAFLGVFENPADAVKAMVQVQTDIEILNQKRRKENLPEILFRIGIHTGPIIRGNVGGHNRYDNTLIGDTVNTASRLESLSKAGDILISETTRKKAGLDIHEDNQFSVKIKGKDGEEAVYQIYDLLKNEYSKSVNS